MNLRKVNERTIWSTVLVVVPRLPMICCTPASLIPALMTNLENGIVDAKCCSAKKQIDAMIFFQTHKIFKCEESSNWFLVFQQLRNEVEYGDFTSNPQIQFLNVASVRLVLSSRRLKRGTWKIRSPTILIIGVYKIHWINLNLESEPFRDKPGFFSPTPVRVSTGSVDASFRCNHRF